MFNPLTALQHLYIEGQSVLSNILIAHREDHDFSFRFSQNIYAISVRVLSNGPLFLYIY